MPDSICPHCRANAPVIMRGLEPRCAACVGVRSAVSLSSAPVNVAGRPSQVGGQVAKALGWLTLIGGALAAVLVTVVLQALFPAGVAGWILGAAILSIAGIAGFGVLTGGKRLHARGVATERDARERAVMALAARRGGALTAAETGSALGVGEHAADDLLTEMARRSDGTVSLEIDHDGRLVYMFPSLRGRARVPVAPSAPPRRIAADDEELDHEDEGASAPLRSARRASRRPSL